MTLQHQLSAVVAVALAGAALPGCAEPAGATAPTGLLVITLDTTRADHIATYGYPRAETPHIDALAAGGVLFEQAVTPVPLTVPAHASLWTGQLPPHHGVRTNEDVLEDASNRTLAELLRERGFRTGAFIGAAVLRRWAGLDQGFETYSDGFPAVTSPYHFGYQEKRAEVVVADAVEWLAGVEDAPFFAWVHLFDPHGPYTPPGEFARRFQDRPYDGEIAYSDAQIGVLLDALARLGLRDRTLVAFVSDHGDGLGEHGEVSHGLFLYDTTLRVPFLLSCPGVLPRGRRVRSQVSLVDFLPTVLDLLRLGAVAEIAGRDLRPAIDGEEADETAAYGETLYPLAAHGWSPIHSLRRDAWKVVRAPTPELYDLGNDPAELRNLYDQQPERAREMLAELAAIERAAAREPVSSGAAPDPQRVAALESLGYVAGGGTEPGRGPLRDPKEGIATLHDLGRARRLLSDRQAEKAVTLLEDLARREPGSPQVQELLGSTLLALQRFDEAREVYLRLLELVPHHGAALTNLGLLAISAGDDERAVDYLERALQENPDDPSTLLNLGQLLYGVRGDRARGRPYLERFLELAPDDPAAGAVREMLSRE